MTNHFLHEKKSKEYLFYILQDGESKAITFGYTSELPDGIKVLPKRQELYSHISLTTIENASKSDSLMSFIQWAKCSKDKLKWFLDKHSIELNDIKILTLNYQEPIEEEVTDVKLSYYLKEG